MQELKVYFAAARDLADGSLADCKIITTNYEKAEQLAREYFNKCLEHYEFEVVEDEPEDEEILEEGVYNDAPANYAYLVFC